MRGSGWKGSLHCHVCCHVVLDIRTFGRMAARIRCCLASRFVFLVFRVVSVVCSGVAFVAGLWFGLMNSIVTMISIVLITKIIRSSIIIFLGVAACGKIANFAGFYMFRD